MKRIFTIISTIFLLFVYQNCGEGFSVNNSQITEDSFFILENSNDDQIAENSSPENGAVNNNNNASDSNEDTYVNNTPVPLPRPKNFPKWEVNCSANPTGSGDTYWSGTMVSDGGDISAVVRYDADSLTPQSWYNIPEYQPLEISIDYLLGLPNGSCTKKYFAKGKLSNGDYFKMYIHFCVDDGRVNLRHSSVIANKDIFPLNFVGNGISPTVHCSHSLRSSP